MALIKTKGNHSTYRSDIITTSRSSVHIFTNQWHRRTFKKYIKRYYVINMRLSLSSLLHFHKVITKIAHEKYNAFYFKQKKLANTFYYS